MKKARFGFTLIETIFSSLFIGVTVLAILNLFPGAYLSIRKSETQLQADFVTKSVLDELRLVPFSQLEEGYTPPPGAPFDPWVVEGIIYTPRVEIYEVPDTQFDFLKGVRVTVTYRLQLTEKTVVHETYLHKLIR
jgi:Tfp pilus assembly protein PilV